MIPRNAECSSLNILSSLEILLSPFTFNLVIVNKNWHYSEIFCSHGSALWQENHMTLRWYESAFSQHFKLCLTPVNHHALQRGTCMRIRPVVRPEMPLISCIKGDHLIIPGALGQGATAERWPMLFFLDERRWVEGMPLHCLQCARGFSVPAHLWGTTSCHHAQKANIETITKTNTYP